MTVLNQYPAYCLTCKTRRPANHGVRSRSADGAWVCACNGPPAADRPTFVPSEFQAPIRTALETTTTHLVIGSVAGSGKTTTCDWLMRDLTATLGKVAYFVFNRDLKESAEQKVPHSVTVRTLNSFGFAQLKKNLRKYQEKADDNKMRNLAIEMFPVENHPHADAHKLLLAPLVALAELEKATLAGNPQRLAEHYGVDLGDCDLGLLWEAVPRLVAKGLEVALEHGYYDFDDQVYLPATQAWTIEQFDTIFVDECQDLNESQVRMVLKAAGRNGRIVAVGDRYQAIYGFRGAGITAFDDLLASLRATSRGAVELPLSVCYRCPEAAAEIVNRENLLVDAAGKRTAFLVRPGAPKGVVEHVSDKKLAESLMATVEAFGGKVEREKLMVLCPRNAPLVRPCLQLLVRGIKATIRGRDIGQEIINLILRVNPGAQRFSQRNYKVGQEDVGVLLQALGKHVRKEVEKLMKAEKEAAAEKIMDQQMVVVAFAEEAEQVSSIVTAIENVFSETAEGVIFSTVHRMKGGQADTVYLMEEWNMPWPQSKQAWERRQGLNLRYVALTRFQQRLVYVYDEKHAPDDEDEAENYNDLAGGEEGDHETDEDHYHGLDQGCTPSCPAYEKADAPEGGREHAANEADCWCDREAREGREDYTVGDPREWEPPSEEEQAQMDADAEGTDLEQEHAHIFTGEDTVPPAPAATFDGLSPAAEYDGAVLVDTLAKLPSLPSEGKGRGFVSPTLRDWQEISGLYLKAGCSVGLHKPPRWVQHAFDVTLPGVTVRCSTTVEGFGETREKGANAIDIVVVNREGRPIDGQTRVLRTDAWQGRVVERVNALLRKHAKIGGR